MNIPTNVLREKLKNVYFLWGRGKTTIANKLHEKYGFCIYRTDDGRDRLLNTATPEEQPYMCRDYEREYGVCSFWELPPEVIADREKHFLAEVTPMMVADLMILAAQHRIVICEGDIDYAAIAPIASHTVYLQNCGTTFDWFNRPDHENFPDTVRKRTDLTEAEKQALIDNAYRSVANENESILPEWVTRLDIKHVRWDDSTSIEQTACEVEACFGLGKTD